MVSSDGMVKHSAAEAQCQHDSHEMGPLAMISAFMASAEGGSMGQPCAHGRGELPSLLRLAMHFTPGPSWEPQRDALLHHAL